MSDSPERIPNTGGVVLCGGQSRRMGTPKHLLPFGGRTMLEHVVAILSPIVRPIAVVCGSAEQRPPDLPPDVLVVHDERPGLGPLAGMLAGLESLSERCDAAYVTACDAPLLKPGVVRFLADSRGDADAAVFRDGEFVHVLAGVYSTGLTGVIRSLIAAERLRPLDLVKDCRSKQIDVAAVSRLDPAGDSFRNVNTPEDYAASLRIAGLG